MNTVYWSYWCSTPEKLCLERLFRCRSGVTDSRRCHAPWRLTFAGYGENQGYTENNTSKPFPVLDTVFGPGRYRDI
jgi:hypothetical protein